MLRSSIVASGLLALFCVCQTGCLLNHTNHMVLRQDEAVKPLTFESEATRNSFEARVTQANEDNDDQSSASFGVPFIIGLEMTKKVSSSGIRNDLATQIDINGDSHISNYEISLN